MQQQEEEDQDNANNISNNINNGGYDYEEDSLLHLIVGVQSYLSEFNTMNVDRNDSPLVDLQYKMYTYLKQRACEMGVDMETAAAAQQQEHQLPPF
ncbi:hypothetical protein BDB00DRAFT_762685 [Zychaea mexicana]|uniref:uncharacterized protein n=1 Tax=Zychaea mexicana TaxID=64656 RepID=UPI0022FE60AF|nr:uncharacterized protein BDB00DRAFT_762685 [Zychaea mexicana]KAI9494104.1 hypothetical protein BDB00DRAFT_762685 [Zychaea mexicana]